MTPQTVGSVSLDNEGVFLVSISFQYLDSQGKKHRAGTGSSFAVGNTRIARPGDYGVPEGATFSLYANVTGGTHKIGSESFVYRSASPDVASYKITGTTLNNHLKLLGVAGWTNWAGSLTCAPQAILRPTNVQELGTMITSATGKVRAFGTGHSWSPLVPTPDNLIDLSHMSDERGLAWRWQKDGLNLVSFLPSARWSDVRDALTTTGTPLPPMYLPTAGVLPSINATGFVAAGCHGTGWHQPTVADLIYSVDIVAADGSLHTFSEDTTPDAMPAVRTSLGTLGIIAQTTLRVEPMYNLWDQELARPTSHFMGPNPADGPIDPTVLAKVVTQNDYVELFWFPWSGWNLGGSLSDGQIWAKLFNRTQEAPRDIPPKQPDWQIWFADKLMEQVAEYPTSSVAKDFVPLIEWGVWQALSAQISAIESTNGFVAPAPVVLHYQESAFPVIDLEMAIPIPATGPNSWDFTNVVTAWYQVVNYVRGRYGSGDYPLTCCLHARFIKNSQALLSPAYEPEGSDVHYCYIEFLSAFPKASPNPKDIVPFQNMIDQIAPGWVTEMGGRPHWAKYWQSIPGIDVKSLYPQANQDEFNALRTQLDPDHRFINGFLEDLGMF